MPNGEGKGTVGSYTAGALLGAILGALWRPQTELSVRDLAPAPELHLPTAREAAERDFERKVRQIWRPDAVATAPTAADILPELRDSELCTGPELQLQTAGVPPTDGGGTVAEAAAELGRNGRATRQR